MYVEKSLEVSLSASLLCALKYTFAKARCQVRDENAEVVEVGKLKAEGIVQDGDNLSRMVSLDYTVQDTNGNRHRVRDNLRLEKLNDKPWRVTDSATGIDHNI